MSSHLNKFLLFFIFSFTGCNVFSQNAGNIEFVSVSPRQDGIIVTWNSNIEPDLSSYTVCVTSIKGIMYDFCNIKDTIIQIFIPDSIAGDSVFINIYAVDTASNVSGPSRTIGLIPDVLYLNYHHDNNNRIDVEDLRGFLRLYRRYFGKTIWRHTD